MPLPLGPSSKTHLRETDALKHALERTVRAVHTYGDLELPPLTSLHILFSLGTGFENPGSWKSTRPVRPPGAAAACQIPVCVIFQARILE